MNKQYLNIDQWLEKRGPSVGRLGKYPALNGRTHSNFCIPDVADEVDLRRIGDIADITVKVAEVMEKPGLCRGIYIVVDNKNSIFDRQWRLGEEIPVEFSIDRIRCIHERNDG